MSGSSRSRNPPNWHLTQGVDVACLFVCLSWTGGVRLSKGARKTPYGKEVGAKGYFSVSPVYSIVRSNREAEIWGLCVAADPEAVQRAARECVCVVGNLDVGNSVVSLVSRRVAVSPCKPSRLAKSKAGLLHTARSDSQTGRSRNRIASKAN